MFAMVPLLVLVLAALPAEVAPVDVKEPSARRSSMPIGQIGVADPDRLSCKREAAVGSRRKKKICDTKEGWQKREDDAAQSMDPGRRTTGDVK